MRFLVSRVRLDFGARTSPPVEKKLYVVSPREM